MTDMSTGESGKLDGTPDDFAQVDWDAIGDLWELFRKHVALCGLAIGDELPVFHDLNINTDTHTFVMRSGVVFKLNRLQSGKLYEWSACPPFQMEVTNNG